MLEHTFVHVSGVGEATEALLWQSGVLRWSDALDRSRPPAGWRAAAWGYLQQVAAQSVAALHSRDPVFFAQRLQRCHQWRAWPQYRARAACLDIETTGLGHSDAVTVVGLYDGERVHTFVAGENLWELPEALERYSMVITYNGASFDLPFLARYFPHLRLPPLHVDLRHALARLGLRGGLTSIERQLGLPRDPEIAHLDGWDAVRLWYEWQAGSAEARELLIRYNKADICNLELLMTHVYQQLRAQVALPHCAGECCQGA